MLGTLDPFDGLAAFHTYVRQDSVLLPRGCVGRNRIGDWRPWLPGRSRTPRVPRKAWLRRMCPVCVTDPGRGVPLAAGLHLPAGAGFRIIGTREKIGRHHGRWRDVILIERRSPTVLKELRQPAAFASVPFEKAVTSRRRPFSVGGPA